MTSSARAAAVVPALLGVLATVLATLGAGPPPATAGTATVPFPGDGPGAGSRTAHAATSAPTPRVGAVLAVSVDGLNPRAISRLGRKGAPHLTRLLDESASTLNARTQVEMTLTLPNHTGMVTGRRVSPSSGGHGVTWNDDRRRPSTVQRAAGRRVKSVFSSVADAGGSSALFASKTKFTLWKRSWSDDLDLVLINGDNGGLVRSLVADVRAGDRAFRFLHLSEPDVVGHKRGFMGRAYFRAVRKVDRLLGRVLRAVDRGPVGADPLPTAVILTADHGGAGKGHSRHDEVSNYRVPFVVRAPGVTPGADLYDLNDDYADPGRSRPDYSRPRQPVRNGMVANVALDLLGLPPVPGSQLGAASPLDLVAP